MYTIKQAAARTEIPVELLRAWERRYGIVEPDRTASGYRLYSDQAIARLRAMRRLVSDGWTPSTAAATIRTMPPEQIESLAQPAEPPAPDPVAPTADAGELTERFVDAAARLDAAGIEGALDQMAAHGSFEHVASHYVLPALEALGDAWEAGRVDVAGEHAASHATLRRLGAALEAAGRQPGLLDRPVLIGLPPGSRHELGALAFAIALRRTGLPVLYLGPDLPITDWLNAIAATEARGIVLSVVMPGDQAPAAEVAAAVREARPDALIAVGGRSAVAHGDVIRLPDDLVEAADAVRSELARREPAARGGRRS